MNTVDRRAEQAGSQLRRAAQQRAQTMDDPSSLVRRAGRRGRFQAATATALALLVVVAVGSVLSPPSVVIDPVTREVSTWTGASVELPEGWQVGSATLMPNGPTEQFVASTAPLPVGGDTCTQVPEAAMEQLGPEDALVSVQQLHSTEPSGPTIGAIEDWRDEHLNQTEIRNCPHNGEELQLYWFYAQLDGSGYRVLGAFGSQASEERKGEALSVLNSFRPAAVGPLEPGEVAVPDVRGLELSEAQQRLETVGLAGAAVTGEDWQDPTDPDAMVVSQKPGAGETVERGTTVGFRTAVVSEPLCRTMTSIPPRQGDAHDLAATDGYWTMLEDARPVATGSLADAIVQLLEHRQSGDPVADAPARTLDVVTVHHDACHLLANSDAAPAGGGAAWSALPGAPIEGRADHVAVWTGEQMIVWGGATLQEMGTHPDLHETGTTSDPDSGESLRIGERWFDTGATYDPATHSWTRVARSPIAGSFENTGVWTGSELLVLNGRGEAAAYRPQSDAWRLLPPLPVPIAGDAHSAVWTGEEMIVWRYRCDDDGCDTAGAAYAPDTDKWRVIAASPLPPRRWHTAVWTGEEMIVWGGEQWLTDRSTPVGAAYDPTADSWRVIAEAPITSRQWHSATWTGTEMLILGGRATLAGAAYNPADDSWRTIASAPIGSRWWHTATWDGDAVVVWGGKDDLEPSDEGARYDPAADSWEMLSQSPIAGRCHHSAVAAGGSVHVWGGTGNCGGAGDAWHDDGATFTSR